MKKNIIFYIIILLSAAVLAFVFWPKEISTGEKKSPGEEQKIGGSTSTEENINNNNQTTTKQKTMEIKLDNKVTEEITANQGPVMQIDKEADYVAVLKTSEGNIKIQLNASATPVAVNNFIYLARKGFYDNTIFHRVINGFMIQGGDPTGTGKGGPGYKFNHEPFTGEYKRGTIAMANSGLNTNGSQFFIMHSDYPLQPNYVIFGQAVEGLDVVDKIAEAAVKPNNDGSEVSIPVNPVKILSAEIFQVKPIE
jgi:cyclophilin family peptidyl-prolyl cis-trans isomerase